MDKHTASQSASAPRVIILTDVPPINVIPGSTFKAGEPPGWWRLGAVAPTKDGLIRVQQPLRSVELCGKVVVRISPEFVQH